MDGTDLHEMLGKSNKYYPKWWFDVFDGDEYHGTKYKITGKANPIHAKYTNYTQNGGLLKPAWSHQEVFQQQLPPARSKKEFECELCVFVSDQGALITSTTRITMALSTKPPLKAKTKIQVAVDFQQPKTPKNQWRFFVHKAGSYSYWNRQVTRDKNKWLC